MRMHALKGLGSLRACYCDWLARLALVSRLTGVPRLQQRQSHSRTPLFDTM